MVTHPTCDETALAARGILTAIELVDVETLESRLQIAGRTEPTSEQSELLAAVAVRLSRAIRRFRRRRTPHLEGVEVHLHLLRHLARVG